MAGKMLTQQKLEDLIWEATRQILGYSKTKANKSIRMAWPTYNAGGSAPDWKRTEDVCFVRVMPQDNPYNRLRDTEYIPIDEGSATQRTRYTRVLQASWVLYGPHSFDQAELLRAGIVQSQAHGMFYRQGVHVVPDLFAPVRVPELFEGAWWERTDFAATFYEAVTLEYDIGLIKEIPIGAGQNGGIHLHTEKGEVPIHGDTTIE